MEFDTSEAEFYQTTFQNAQTHSALPLSQLYYWSHRTVLDNSSEPSMLLCVPLVSQNGTVFGVCGLEISSMYFKTKFIPDDGMFPRIFSTLAPQYDNTLFMQEGLLAGNTFQTSNYSGSTVNISSSSTNNCYTTPDYISYSGIDCNILLYPSNSIYADSCWTLALMVPEEDMSNAVRYKNLNLILLLSLLLVISLIVAFLISRHYIRPVITTLHSIKTDGASHVSRTNILEIDDLIEFLAEQDELNMQEEKRLKDQIETNMAVEQQDHINKKGQIEKKKQKETSDSLYVNLSAYKEFIQNIETLSKAERAVFNLYLEGYTANEITDILYLSINTIKTHNKRIYMKLNVSSRKELMVYVQMMQQDTKSL